MSQIINMLFWMCWGLQPNFDMSGIHVTDLFLVPVLCCWIIACINMDITHLVNKPPCVEKLISF